VIFRSRNKFWLTVLIIGLFFSGFVPVFALDTTYDLKYAATGTGYGMGSVVVIGDVNNDGIDDLIAGEPSSPNGQVSVYYGSASGPSVTPDKTFTGEALSNGFGVSVSAADINNDGYDDVIAGASSYGTSAGRVYVFFGAADMDTTADVTMTGEESQSNFGYTVSHADVNNDGYEDVIAGAPIHNINTGRAYIFFGGSSMDNTADVTMTAETTGDRFGASVAGAGDVNNDGYDDVIVGARQFISDPGRAYVFFGGSSMDNTADVTMMGEAINNSFGAQVTGGGDVNNDGYDDVVVGASGYSSTTGRVYVFLGGSSMDNTADVTMTGESTANIFGSAVAFGGDINVDGYDDVFVGAGYYPAGNADGRAYLFYGGSSMNNVADVIFDAEHEFDEFASYSTPFAAGDLNDDGARDVLIGAPGADNGVYDGALYVYYGTETTPPTVSVLSPVDDATDVSTMSNLVITFDEAVVGGTGTILIKKTSDDSIVETITTTGGLLSGSGTVIITINPSVTLADGTSYYVTIDPNTFRDAAGNFYAGITNSTTWNFTTAAVVVSAESSSSSSLSAVERQGSGGGRGAGTTTRNTEDVQEAVEERFGIQPDQADIPESVAPLTVEQRRENRIQQYESFWQRVKKYVQRMLVNREHRKQLRLQRLQGV
jgi:hypothetical protein